MPAALALLALALAVLGAALAAAAQTPAPAAPFPTESWAGQMDTMARWFEQHRTAPECTAHCFVLDRLRITGSVDPGPLQFELEGEVLAPGARAVPLFGPASQLRLEAVTEDGHPATLSFENDAYYLYTAARRFVLRGTLVFQSDLALTIPGPLNNLVAELSAGRLVEGARLAALASTTVHFDRGAAQPAAAAPPVFQLARAVRIGREVQFTYRLTMQSATDLGVVRLPLRYNEHVLEVEGSSGWRVEGAELTLPTEGNRASVTITGTMPEATRFEPDARSQYEYWLLESDPEHELTITTDARPVDVSQSPLPAQQASARLYLVLRGRSVGVGVQTLATGDVLAAVIHRHTRSMVLSRQGELVSDDTLEYENSGLDYLAFTPAGRAIFVAADGAPERVLHRDASAGAVLLPLRRGVHSARVQSVGSLGVSSLGGVLVVPSPSYPLTASAVDLTVGLPQGVYPLAVLGGDRASWTLGLGDALAALCALVVAWVLFRRNGTRVLGALSLAGLWFVAAEAYVALVCALVLGGAVWLVGRYVTANLRRGARIATAVVGVVVALGLLVSRGASDFAPAAREMSAATSSGSSSNAPASQAAAAAPVVAMPPADDQPTAGSESPTHRGARRTHASTVPGGIVTEPNRGGELMDALRGGVVQGVTPVAMRLPGYTRAVRASRELVTPQRPFATRIWYVTATAIDALVALWLLCVLLLAVAHRRGIRAVLEGLRRPPPGPPSAPSPPAPSSSPAPHADAPPTPSA